MQRSQPKPPDTSTGDHVVYWAHKASIAAFGDSEVPIDVRVLQYAAQGDGKTLVPHLEVLQRDLPQVMKVLRHVLADDAYKHNRDAVSRFGRQAQLTVPVHPSGKSKVMLAALFTGIDRFTAVGVPVCVAGHRFDMLGRYISNERALHLGGPRRRIGPQRMRKLPSRPDVHKERDAPPHSR